MITLKYWNSLSADCRAKIAQRLLGHYIDNRDDFILNEWHHNFDYNADGKTIKSILESCYLKEGRVEVRCTINPTFSSKTSRTCKKAKPKKQEPKTHTYYFRMYTESDPEDGENVWEEAYSESEARDKVYDDFHSITELDLIRVE